MTNAELIAKIRAEIERRIELIKPRPGQGYILCREMTKMLQSLLSFLDTLPKQEQPVKSAPKWKWVEPGKEYPVGITREMDVNGDWQYCLSSGRLYDGCQYLSLAELERNSIDAGPYPIENTLQEPSTVEQKDRIDEGFTKFMMQEPEVDLEKKECELVTADEDIITIHLGKVLTEEQYDAVLRSVIDHLNKHWWHILRWSS